MNVSVIIPTYNRLSFLKEAIRSVLSQSYANYEILIIDDHSKDNTHVFVKELMLENKDKIKYFLNEKNKGVDGARNTGLEHAEGEYIAFLDSDDIWEVDKLKIQMDLFRKYKDLGAIFSDADFFGEVEKNFEKRMTNKIFFCKRYWHGLEKNFLLADPKLFYFLFCDASRLRIQTLVFKKTIIDTVGYLNESMFYCGDIDFILKIFLSTKVGYLKLKLCKIRRHPFNTDNIFSVEEKCEAIMKVLENIIEFIRRKNLIKIDSKLKKILGTAYFYRARVYFLSNKFDIAKKSLLKSLEIKFSLSAIIALFWIYIFESLKLKNKAG